MSRHYIVYIKRKIVEPFDNISKGKKDVFPALFRPAAHVFGQKWLYDSVAEDDEVTIWMLSMLRSGKNIMPPSLDAKMLVKDKFVRNGESPLCEYLSDIDKKRKFVFVATPENALYFPFNNALSLLKSIRFKSKSTKLPKAFFKSQPHNMKNKKPIYSRLPQHFQTPRLLDDDSVPALEKYGKSILNTNQAFISYRWKEGTPFVRELVKRLADLGIVSWWDRWCMSRSIAELKTSINSDGLWSVITEGIGGSRFAIAINTDEYASKKSPATQEELKLLKAQHEKGKAPLLMVPEKGKLAFEVAQNKDSQRVNKELDRVIDRLNFLLK